MKRRLRDDWSMHQGTCPMTGWVTALGVIIVPGLVSLLLVRRFGPGWGIAILILTLIFLAEGIFTARNPGSVEIAPEFLGGQTIGYSQRLGLREMAWVAFVLAPSVLWAAIALAVGWASYRYAKREEEPK